MFKYKTNYYIYFYIRIKIKEEEMPLVAYTYQEAKSLGIVEEVISKWQESIGQKYNQMTLSEILGRFLKGQVVLIIDLPTK